MIKKYILILVVSYFINLGCKTDSKLNSLLNISNEITQIDLIANYYGDINGVSAEFCISSEKGSYLTEMGIEDNLIHKNLNKDIFIHIIEELQAHNYSLKPINNEETLEGFFIIVIANGVKQHCKIENNENAQSLENSIKSKFQKTTQYFNLSFPGKGAGSTVKGFLELEDNLK